MAAARLALGLLYPEEMNLYGDRGNLLALRRRARLRRLDLGVVRVGLADDPALVSGCSGFLIGGGQDLDQVAVADDLVRRKGPALREAVRAGAPLLAVCAGYQLLGTHYRAGDGTRIPGLGLLPLRTEAGRRRLVGNLVATADPELGLGQATLVGFENHSGRTLLEPGLASLGRVVRGRGNDGRSGREGARLGTVIGTYLHGPLLPKNPAIADWWLETAAAHSRVALGPRPPDDSLEEAARREAISVAMSSRPGGGYRLLGRERPVRRTG